MTNKERIAVMQAYDMGKEIEFTAIHFDNWNNVEEPTWDWSRFLYRVKPNKFKTLKEEVKGLSVSNTRIAFGGIESYVDQSTKIVYDTHIRKVLLANMNVGDVAAFRLVPLNAFSESIIDLINESEYAK